MKKLRAWFASSAGKRFFNIFYSLGAAIVVIGAMFKIIHVQGADIIFVIGMTVEALVFALSAFDTSSYDSTPVTVAQGIAIDDASNGSAINVVGGTTNSNNTTSSLNTHTTGSATTQGSGGSPSVIVVGGGNGGGNFASTSNNTASDNTTTSGSSPVFVGGSSGGGQNTNVVVDENLEGTTKEYSQNMASAAQNLEDFSKTMQSLNETSQVMLDTYKQIADNQNMGETMNTVRYINDSLLRIKNLYDGAIGDSYMFKEEMSKMTRHIEALNNVYARLLQAMTANNPSNNNNPPY